MTLKDKILDFTHDVVENKDNIEPIIEGTMDTQILTSGPIGKEIGIKGMILATQVWFDAFPDAKVEKLVVTENSNDNSVVLEWNMSAHHQNDFCGIQASGNKILYDGVAHFRFRDGKVIEHSYNTSMKNIFKQMGAEDKADMFVNFDSIKQDFALLLQTISQFGTSKEILGRSEVICIAFHLMNHQPSEVSCFLNVPISVVENNLDHAKQKLGCQSKEDLFALAESRKLLHIIQDFYYMLRALTFKLQDPA